MKETLISFETAKLAKEKGLKGFKTYKFYYKDGIAYNSTSKQCWNTWEWTQGIRWTVITQSLLQKWLREKHDIQVEVSLPLNRNWNVDGYFINSKKGKAGEFNKVLFDDLKDFDTYEQALEIGLKRALETLQEQTK